jgi:hypothetical protein
LVAKAVVESAVAARAASVRAAAETEAAVTVAVATVATRTATTAVTMSRVAAVKEAPREASVEEVVEEAVRAAARVVAFTSTGARATRSARAARLVAGALWRHSWSRRPTSRAARRARMGERGAVAREQSERGSAHLQAAAPPPRPPSRWDHLRVQAATPRRRRRRAGAWAWSRRQQRRQGRRDPGRTEPVSCQRLARARTARQHAGSTVCGRRRVATLVVSPGKGHAAAESGERACAAAHVGAGGGHSLSTRGARLTSRVFGSALAPVTGALERRRDDDPGAPVRDARELALDEGGGRHPLVTTYSFIQHMNVTRVRPLRAVSGVGHEGPWSGNLPDHAPDGGGSQNKSILSYLIET